MTNQIMKLVIYSNLVIFQQINLFSKNILYVFIELFEFATYLSKLTRT